MALRRDNLSAIVIPCVKHQLFTMRTSIVLTVAPELSRDKMTRPVIKDYGLFTFP